MSPEAPPDKLPWLLRAAAWVCLVLSGMVALASAQEAVVMLRLPELRDEARPALALTMDPVIAERTWRAQLQALEGMRGSRTLLLTALALCCGLSLMGATRLLWPAGLPREPVRQLLSGTALAAGILRTLDGAQSTVVARRVGHAIAAAMSEGTHPADPAVAEMARQVGPFLAMAGTILQTVVVAGAFVAIGQYLRSERVRQRLSS